MNTLLFSSLCIFALVSAQIPAQGTPAYTNDINVLNYALTLENLEAAYYAQGLQIFTQDVFTRNNYSSAYPWFVLVRDHEAAHVSALRSTIQSLGANPLSACTYNFTNAFSSFGNFLATARVLENTGVSAYIGAFQDLSNPAFIEFGATVATVEARHAAYLNLLNQVSPFPNVTDSPLMDTVVKAQIAPFLINCPDGLPLQLATADSFRNVTFNQATVFNRTSAAYLNDNNALNYALTLENLEANFYSTSFSKINDAAFIAAGINGTTLQYLKTIGEHETLHASTLNTIITARGGTPNPACTYNFTAITTVAAFLSAAITLESTGVSAYDGAHVFFSDASLLTAAAGIATVEARHTSFLLDITGQTPFPANTDTPLKPAAVLAGAKPFIVSCPYDVTANLPVDALNFRQGVNTTSTSTGSTGATSTSTGATTTGATTTASTTTGSTTTASTTTGATTARATTGSSTTGSGSNNGLVLSASVLLIIIASLF